jgi:hypothetical protein
MNVRTEVVFIPERLSPFGQPGFSRRATGPLPPPVAREVPVALAVERMESEAKNNVDEVNVALTAVRDPAGGFFNVIATNLSNAGIRPNLAIRWWLIMS